ncbi:MAG: glycosyltransferase [Cyclobacteriaceae bacterium]|nr:glycosyltransferase [Cyclobacteriaceae bacterium]
MDISIIIPTYNRREIFDQTLGCAIDAVKHLQAEIIIVNDVNGEGLIIPEIQHVPITVVRNTKSGVASKRNLGASLAKSNLLLFLDNDILISRDSVDHIIELHAETENITVNPNWIYPPSLASQLSLTAFGRFMILHNLVSFKGWYSHSSWRDDELFRSESVASFHLSISRDNFIKSGGYNENFAEAGFEDYDFPLRLKKINISFFIDTRIHVFHNEEDMITLESWLIRQQRGAFTRKEAVSLGYAELKLHYGFFKIILFCSIRAFRPVLLIILKALAQKTSFDTLSFRLILLLQAQSIYRGYSHKVLHK